jgi:hypothetical protein
MKLCHLTFVSLHLFWPLKRLFSNLIRKVSQGIIADAVIQLLASLCSHSGCALLGLRVFTRFICLYF